jgi:hypothetical protein
MEEEKIGFGTMSGKKAEPELLTDLYRKVPGSVFPASILFWDEPRKKLVLEINCDAEMYEQIQDREVTGGEVELVDGRRISTSQRNLIRLLIGDISEHWGWYGKLEQDSVHFHLKKRHCFENQVPDFSLSDCSITTARGYIGFLINLILMEEIPTIDIIRDHTDYIGEYLYACVLNKVCAICRKKADYHHGTGHHVGMGRNRNYVPLLGTEGYALCRGHHTEAHTMGQGDFNRKYHIYPIKVDQAIINYWSKKQKRKLK